MTCQALPAAPEVTDHLPLVRRLANRYARRSRVPLADLIQEGCIAAMQALRRFDPARGTPVEAWLAPRIREHLSRVVKKDFRHWPRRPSAEVLAGIPARPEGEGKPAVAELLAKLPAPERQALALWVGLDGPALTYKKLGETLGFSGQRAFRLVQAGLARLRRLVGVEE